mgnify:CR=1 FL=1
MKIPITLYWIIRNNGEAEYNTENVWQILIDKIKKNKLMSNHLKKVSIYKMETFLTDDIIIRLLNNNNMNHCRFENYQKAELIYQWEQK